eukprot:6443690-Karenia_brevis.AAC.1
MNGQFQRHAEIAAKLARSRASRVRAGLEAGWKPWLRAVARRNVEDIAYWRTWAQAEAAKEDKWQQDQSDHEWREWARKSVQGGAAAAHKFTKKLRGEFAGVAQNGKGLDELADEKACFWGQMWQEEANVEIDWPSCEALPKITPQQLLKAAAKFKDSTG